MVDNKWYEFGHFRLEGDPPQLWPQETGNIPKEVPLTRALSSVLMKLVTNAPRPVSYEDLFDDGRRDPNEYSVNGKTLVQQTIRRLRLALGDNGSLIELWQNSGYIIKKVCRRGIAAPAHVPNEPRVEPDVIGSDDDVLGSDELEAFGVSFPGHRVEMQFGANFGGGIPLEWIECLPEVSDIQPLSGELRTARDAYILARQEDAGRKKVEFEDNRLLGAASWCPGRRDTPNGRVRYASLGFRNVCFFDHIFLGHGLNRDISDWLRTWSREDVRDKQLLKKVQRFLRSKPKFIPAEELRVPIDKLKLADAEKWPMIPFRVGLGVVIFTRDKKVIVPLRSSKVCLGDTHARSYSSSVGEGMTAGDTVRSLPSLRPKRTRTGRRKGAADRPSLMALAARALRDEMGIRDQVHCDVSKDVLCVSLNFDRREAFPYLSTMLRTRHSFDEINRLWKGLQTPDMWENEGLLGLPWNKRTAKGLAIGRLEVKGYGLIVAASTREQIFFAQAADALGMQ